MAVRRSVEAADGADGAAQRSPGASPRPAPLREVEAKDASAARRLVSEHAPFVWRGASATSAAVARWTPAWFGEAYPELEVDVEVWPVASGGGAAPSIAPRRERRALREYVAGMSAPPTGERLYLAELSIERHFPELVADLPALRPIIGLPASLPRALTDRLVLPPLLWIGPAGTVSSTHFDAYQNLFLQVSGEKKFTLFSPADSPNLYYPRADGDWRALHLSPVDVDAADLRAFPRFADARPIEVELGPGDVLHIPSGWWHHVRSLTESVSVNTWWVDFDALRRASPFLLRQALLRSRERARDALRERRERRR